MATSQSFRMLRRRYHFDHFVDAVLSIQQPALKSESNIGNNTLNWNDWTLDQAFHSYVAQPET